MTKAHAKEKIKSLIAEYEELKNRTSLKDFNEAYTKQRFIQPLFEALGWDFHKNVWPEEKISKDRVDYAFKIDDIVKFFLEAKKFSVNLQEDRWAEQAIDYSWNKSVTWAVLSDFEGLKIFNSEWKQKPYRPVKEFKYTDYLTRFDEIWLLSKESFEQQKLDKQAEEWGVKERKIPVTEQLAQDLLEWRDGITKEVRSWNEKLTKDEIDEAVQRFLDRLIFIRYTEDKELESRILEPMLREYKKSSGDLIGQLNQVFRKFDTWYDSKLFEKHFSEELEAYSGELEKVIEGLYRSKKSGHPYDFSAISADVLGAVYEQYLGYLQKNGSAKSKASKRKEQGIYYTPVYIVENIVQNTLGRILKEKTGSEIKRLKILDPACGSGSFLIKAYQVLVEYFQNPRNRDIDTNTKLGQIEKVVLEKKGIVDLTAAQKMNLLRDNLCGIDLDPKAVEISQLNLLLRALIRKTKLPDLSHRIVCGNSLISGAEKSFEAYFGKQWKMHRPINWNETFRDVFQEGGFDVIIGNPPYIDSEEMTKTQPEIRRYLNSQYKSAHGNWDIYCVFLEKSLQLLKDGGYLGMIVPNKLLSANYAEKTRKLIQEYKIVAIHDYSRVSVFEASVYPIVIIIKKESGTDNKINIQVATLENGKIVAKNYKTYGQNKLNPKNWSPIFEEKSVTSSSKVFAKSKLLKEICKVHGAATVSEAYAIKDIIIEHTNQGEHFRFINTGSIDRYRSLWGIKNTSYIKKRFAKPIILEQTIKKLFPKRHNDSISKKIIVGGMTKRLECFYDKGKYIAGKSTSVIMSEKVNLKYLLALLNSKFLSYYYRTQFKSLALGGGFLNIGPKQLEQLPIIVSNDEKQKNLISLVDRMLELNDRLNEATPDSDEVGSIKDEITKADQAIDSLVYQLYNLTSDKISLIEQSFKDIKL